MLLMTLHKEKHKSREVTVVVSSFGLECLDFEDSS